MELTNTFTVEIPIDVTWPVLCDIERIAPCMPGARLTEIDGDVFKGEVKIKVGPINAKFKGTAEMTERDDDAHQAVLSAKGKDTGGKGNAHATITATAKSAGSGTEVTISTDLSITGKVAQFGRGALDDISTKLLGQFVDCLETKVLAGEDGGDEGASAGDGPSEKGSTAASEEGSGASDAGVSSGSARGNGSRPEAARATAGAGSPVATAPAPPPGGMPAGTAATGGEAAAGTPGASTAAPSSGAGTTAEPAASSGRRKIDSPDADPIDLLDAAGGTETVKKAAGPVAAVMAVFFVIWWWRRRS